MKILFITGLWPSNQNPYQGVFVKEHALSLAKLGSVVTVIQFKVVPGTGFLATSFEKEKQTESGLTVFNATVKTRWPKWVENSRILLWLLFKNTILKSLQPLHIEVVVGNFIHPGGVLAHFIAQSLRKPFYLIEHWSGLEKHLKTHPEAYWSKKALARAQGVAAVSYFLAEKIKPFTKDNQVSYIPNVISSKSFTLKQSSIDNSKKHWHFLSVMNLQRPKLPHLAALALKEWQKQNPNFQISYTIAGEGPLKTEIDSILKNSPIQIQFLGAVSKENLIAEYQKADLTLHPTGYETFGVVPVESVYCGTPVIASKVAALPENIQDGINGLLVENTPESFLAAIQKATSQNWNPEQVRNSLLQKFDYEVVGNKLLQFLKGK